MLLFFLCLLFCGVSNGECTVQCDSDHGLSFLEATDGVHGRYRLQWCTQVDGPMGHSAKWIVSLRYDITQTPEDCRQDNSKSSSWKEHSYYEDNVTIDCKNVCLSTNFDLIFNGTCYAINTHLRKSVNGPEGISMEVQRLSETEDVFYIYNNYTKDGFSKSEAYIKSLFLGDHVEVHWFLHLVPVTNYTMEQCSDTQSQCRPVTSNCSVAVPNRTQLLCELWSPATRFNLLLRHKAPWTAGLSLFDSIEQVKASIDLPPRSSAPPAVQQPASATPWWTVGGVLALVGVAVLACHSLCVRKLRERVQQDWPVRTQTVEVGKPDGGGGRVLLLYARDCAPMLAVAARLRGLLQRSADCVYDLYSPETVRTAARAPAEWLRRCMARDDVRVVLLQSPAAACLHAPRLRPPALQLEQPLLPRRVQYRAPHAGDALLPLALRLLADTAHTTHCYKKYYIATISGLEAELVREVTPLRRYLLPAAAELLLRDVGGGSAPSDLPRDPALDQQLEELARAVRDLHDHVRAHPDYLDDELIFFDYD